MRKACCLIVVSLIASVSLAMPPISLKTRISSTGDFEENKGQAPEKYRFLYQDGTTSALFSEDAITFVLHSTTGTSQVKLSFSGSSREATLRTKGGLASRSNYFLGNDPNLWIRNVPHARSVIYKGVYPGTDVTFHGTNGQFEQDFRLAAGADPGKIQILFSGARDISSDGSGGLRVSAPFGSLSLRRPEAYQETPSGRRSVPVQFATDPKGAISFRVGTFDHTRALVIDPVFSFSTYLVGSSSGSNSTVTAVTTDNAGNIYVTGYAGTSFPIVDGVQPTLNGTGNAFISKFDPTGQTLLYSTYLGGAGTFGNAVNYASAIALDPSGNIIVTGSSEANDFPHAGSVPPVNCASNHACFFISSLSPDGSSLNYSGLVGGGSNISDSDYGNEGRLAVDSQGNAYVAGVTDDATFQITPGTLSKAVPGYPYNSTVVLKVDSTGALVYCTIVPGTLPYNPAAPSTDIFVPAGMVVDSNGQVTIAGTAGPGLPSTSGVIQPTFPNDLNNTNPDAGFVFQLNATASAINYATYVPGTDWVLAMTADKSGNLYLTGVTGESNLPVSGNAYQKSILQYTSSGFVVKMNATGTAIPAASYIEGSAGAGFSSVALDSNSNVFIGGGTTSTDFPLVNPFLSEWVFGTTNSDMVISELSPDLSSLLFGSFLSAVDQIYSAPEFFALSVDSQDNLIVVGDTYATHFPTTASFEPNPPDLSGQIQRGFVTKLDMTTPAPSVCSSTWSFDFGIVAVGQSSTQTVNVTNCGNAPLLISSAVSSIASVVVNQACGSISPGSACAISLTFTPKDQTAFDGTLALAVNAPIQIQVIRFIAQGGGGSGPIGFVGAYQGSTSATVAAGGTANFKLMIGGSGNGGPGTFSCANAPSDANCSVPTTLTIDPVTPQMVNVAISTTARAGASSTRINLPFVWALALMGLIVVGKCKLNKFRLREATGLAFLLTLASCGGSGTSPGGPPPQGGTPAGTYTVIITATSGLTSEALPLSLTVQ